MGHGRIQQRLLFAFLGVVAAVLIPAALMLDSWIGDSVRDVERDGLVRVAQALSGELARAQPADVTAWVAGLHADGVRVTVIDGDGVVLGDTDVPATYVGAVENHLQRPEVQTALHGGVGVSERRSATVSRSLLYVAVPVDGPPHRRVLRVAISLDTVRATVGRAHAAVWLAGLMALTLALLLGAMLSRWLTRPILAMTRAARAMTHGQFDATLPPARDDELGDLVHALDTLRNELAARMAELAQEGSKLRAVVNGMSEGVALVQDGDIVVANPAFARLLGNAATIESRPVRDVIRLPSLSSAIDAAVGGGKGSTCDFAVGGRALVASIDPLDTSEGAAVVVLLDVTEARRAERLRREFVANASHELRTPVAAIVGVAETLAAGAAEDPAARQSFLDILVRHAQRLSRLTAELLDIARLEGGYKPRVEIVAVAEAVDAVVTTLQPKAEAKRIALSHRVPPAVSVSAERAAVEQIVTNLVDNAIKYTPEGGRVSVSAERLKDNARARVRIVVEDSGPGIPPEHHARLFERFYRVDDARSRDLGGTGLGLAIVKHLALANGGDVSVDSSVGKGSRFIVELPAAAS